MITVCKAHVTKGLHLLPVPHVKEMPKNKKIPCYFCEQPATINLFLFNNIKEKDYELLPSQTIKNG